MHANNTVLRHLEKSLAKTTMVFEYTRVVAKNIGDRSGTRHEGQNFKDYVDGLNGPEFLRIRSLTGVRFCELINDSAKHIKNFELVKDFVESREYGNWFKREYSQMTEKQSFQFVQIDLAVLNLFNTFFFNPAYKAAVLPETESDSQVKYYRDLLAKVLDVLKLDCSECFEIMLKADELPFISKFYQPDGIQLEALDFFEELDDQQMSRVLLMVGKIKEVVIRSILLTNSTLLQIDCNNIFDKADLHNNACER